MRKIENDLTKGCLPKQILLFSIPLMLSNILQILFNMSDLAVVGRFVGPHALGAVGSTTTLGHLFTGFLIGIGGGVNVLAARYFGAKDDKSLKEFVHTAFSVCLIMGVTLCALGEALTVPVLKLLGTKAELIDGARLYMRIFLLGLPAMAVYNFGSAVFSAIGNTRKPLTYMLLAGVINVLLNLFFVIVCKMDVEGVAIATIISQYASAAMILIALIRSKEKYAFDPKKISLHKRHTADLLKLGLPGGFQFCVFAISNLFIQAGINSFDAITVDGNSAAGNIDSVIFNGLNAIYTACASFIGQNYGAKNKERIRKSYFICQGYAIAIAAVYGAVVLLFGRSLLSIFTSEEAVKDAGMIRIRIMGLTYIFSCWMDCAMPAARGLGKSIGATVILFLGSCVFRIVWIYTVFASFGTLQSLYLLYVTSWVMTGIAGNIYLLRCYRLQTRDFSALPPPEGVRIRGAADERGVMK